MLSRYNNIIIPWDAAQPTGQTPYNPRGMVLAGGNHRDQNGNWVVPPDVNLPIISLEGPYGIGPIQDDFNQDDPDQDNPGQDDPVTIGQDVLRAIEGRNYALYPPPQQPKMKLYPAFAAMHDINLAIKEALRAKLKEEAVRNGTYHQNKLPAAQRERREVGRVDVDEMKRMLAESGLEPPHEKYENDTEDDSDFESRDARKHARKLRVQVDEGRKEQVLNGMGTFTYAETMRGVLRARPTDYTAGLKLPEAERPELHETARSNFLEAKRPNSHESESYKSDKAKRRSSERGGRHKSGDAKKRVRFSSPPNGRDSNEATRRDFEEGKSRRERRSDETTTEAQRREYDVTGILNPSFENLLRRHRQAAKSTKEQQAPQSQPEDDAPPRDWEN